MAPRPVRVEVERGAGAMLWRSTGSTWSTNEDVV
jgi:hypothetical protein